MRIVYLANKTYTVPVNWLTFGPKTEDKIFLKEFRESVLISGSSTSNIYK